MFENYTYDYILSQALANVKTKVDKREGSIIFDTLSPLALELANIYINLDIILRNAFAETAEREYLILIAKERGLSPFDATHARLRADFNFRSSNGKYESEVVEEGNRFNLDKLNYTVISQLINETGGTLTIQDKDGNTIKVAKNAPIPGAWCVECESAGAEGNKHFGTLSPLSTINNLTKAEITELLVPGEDEEDTESFRTRYFESINKEAFGGNRADYIKWVKEMDGVGQVKIKRAPNGGGTVGVIITDANGNPASTTLINTVKDLLDPKNYEGEGEGIAPVGHKVSVSTVTKLSTDVEFYGIEYESGFSYSKVESQLKDAVNAYADEVNANWENTDKLKVYAAQILAKCLDIDGIVNIESVTLSGDSYLTLNENQIIELAIPD